MMSDFWWKEGARFTCIGCGRCCRGEPGAIFFTPEEEKSVREYLGLGEDDFRQDYVTLKWGKENPSFIERLNGDCVFLVGGAKCSIYHHRPAQCSIFPFWPSVMESRAAWDEHARHCPGMNDGRLYTEEEIQKFLIQCPFEDL